MEPIISRIRLSCDSELQRASRPAQVDLFCAALQAVDDALHALLRSVRMAVMHTVVEVGIQLGGASSNLNDDTI